jgi:hypothetical protein
METLQDILRRMVVQHLERQAQRENKPDNSETSDTRGTADMNDFCNTKAACKILDCSATSLYRYRKEGKLLEGIHYGGNPGGRKILYNVELLNHLVSCGGDVNDRSHQQAIAQYLASRPENQPQKRGRKRAGHLQVVAD